MKKRSQSALLLALAIAGFAIVDCSSTVDEVTTRIDCRTVCKRYADCFQSDYDVDGCSDKCDNSGEADAERQRRLKMCDACIDEPSCTAATFNCADACAGIVP